VGLQIEKYSRQLVKFRWRFDPRAHCACSICERNCVTPLDVLDRTSASASKCSTSESRYRTPRPSFKHGRIPLRSRRFNVSTDNFQRLDSSLRVTN
jgi:hypothetical protein